MSRLLRAGAALVAVGLGAGCGSNDESTITVAPSPATSAPATTGATATTDTVGTPPPSRPEVELVETWEEVEAALPALAVTTDAASHVIELRLRTLEVRVADGQVCLGGGELAGGPENCAALAETPSLLVYSDNSSITPVYAVLVGVGVTVEFETTGQSLTCFTEPATRLGPVAVWWCEDLFASTIRFVTPEGRTLQVSVG